MQTPCLNDVQPARCEIPANTMKAKRWNSHLHNGSFTIVLEYHIIREESINTKIAVTYRDYSVLFVGRYVILVVVDLLGPF
jgi:hypothetical protein